MSRSLRSHLHTGVAIWSNDNDFYDAGVEWFTTSDLLERLRRKP